MTDQIAQIIIAVIQSGALGFFVFIIFRGLKTEIKTLNKTIETQNKTLEVMEKRINETEKVGEIYQNLITNLPDAIDKYKKIIEKTMGETIKELEKANEEKNEILKKSKENELEELKTTKSILNEIPKLYKDMMKLKNEFDIRINSLPLGPKFVPPMIFQRPVQTTLLNPTDILYRRIAEQSIIHHKETLKKIVGIPDEQTLNKMMENPIQESAPEKTKKDNSK